jgi:hypothetical protein
MSVLLEDEFFWVLSFFCVLRSIAQRLSLPMRMRTLAVDSLTRAYMFTLHRPSLPCTFTHTFINPFHSSDTCFTSFNLFFPLEHQVASSTASLIAMSASGAGFAANTPVRQTRSANPLDGHPRETNGSRGHENASCGSDKDCGLHTTRADVLPCLPGPAGMESTGSRGAARCFPLPRSHAATDAGRRVCPQELRGERYARGRGAGGQPQRPAPLASSATASDRSEGAPFAFLSISTCHMFEPSRAHAHTFI